MSPGLQGVVSVIKNNVSSVSPSSIADIDNRQAKILISDQLVIYGVTQHLKSYSPLLT